MKARAIPVGCLAVDQFSLVLREASYFRVLAARTDPGADRLSPGGLRRPGCVVAHYFSCLEFVGSPEVPYSE